MQDISVFKTAYKVENNKNYKIKAMAKIII